MPEPMLEEVGSVRMSRGEAEEKAKDNDSVQVLKCKEVPAKASLAQLWPASRILLFIREARKIAIKTVRRIEKHAAENNDECHMSLSFVRKTVVIALLRKGSLDFIRMYTEVFKSITDPRMTSKDMKVMEKMVCEAAAVNKLAK